MHNQIETLWVHYGAVRNRELKWVKFNIIDAL